MRTLFLFSFCLILVSCSKKSSTEPESLDLSKPEQQIDFRNYLETTLDLLQTQSLKVAIQGYNFKNLSETDKKQIANKMFKDISFKKKFEDYWVMARGLEKKY